MPIYNIQGPDGRIYSLEGPEGATEDQVINALKANLSGQGIGSLPAPKPEGGFIPAVQRGFLQTGMLLGDILPAMVGRAFGADEYAERQFKEAAETEKKIQEKYAPAVASYKDIKGVGDAVTYAVEAVGELVPSILPSLFTGGAASIIGRGAVIAAKEAAEATARKQIAEKGVEALTQKEVMDQIRKAGIDAASKTALKYETVGAVTGSATQNVPEVYKNIKDETEQESLGASLLFGGFNSLLDAALPLSLMIKARKAGIPGEEIVGEWYKRFGKGATKGFATEGATEAAQEMSSAAAEKFVDENQEFFSEKNLERFLNAGLKGGLGGGVISGTTDVMLGKRSLTEGLKPLDEDIRNTQSDILARRDFLNELRAQAAEEGKYKLDAEALKDLGFGTKYSLYDSLLNKDINDPAQAQEVVQLLQTAVADPATKGRERVVAANTLEVINPYLESIGEPDVGQVVEEPSGAGVSVPPTITEPAPAEGVGGVEPTGMVPPVTDVGAPVGGEGLAPAPVAPVETAAAPAAVPPAPPVTEPPVETVPTTRDLIAQQETELAAQMDKFQNLLQQQVQRFGLKDVAVKVVDDLKNANAQYSKGLIKLAVNAVDPVRDLRHESVHALKELGFFTPGQWDALVRRANESWINTYLRNRDIDGNFIEPGKESRYDAYVSEFKKQGLNDAQMQEALVEEAISDAFGDFNQTKAPPGMMQAILNRMKNFFRSIKEAVGLAEVDPETLFGRIERAELAAPVDKTAAKQYPPEEKVASTKEREGEPEGQAKPSIARVKQVPTAGRSEPTGDRGGRDQGRSLAPLDGAPVVSEATGPDPRIVRVAEDYAKSVGIPLERQPTYVDVDEDRAKRIAQAYEDMPHAPQDPAVKEAYADMLRQTRAQYDALVDAGYEFTFFDSNTDPYGGNPWNAMRDLRKNKRMAVYGTYDGYGTEGITGAAVEDNPMLADTGLRWRDQGGVEHMVTANDLFRAVHDAFGHGMEGAGFRARGEENAWQAHARLFTGPALGALTSETRGQNSWLNYGPYGEKNRTAKLEDTVFAQQKTGLMPEWTWQEGLTKEKPVADRDAKFSLRIMRGQEVPKIEGRITVDKIGKYFDDQIKADFGRALDYNNPEDFARALKIANEEVDYQLKQEKSGLDWYEDDVRLAFEDTAKVIPQLENAENRVLFSVIAGIMSPQTTARDNWFIAAKAYQHYVETGNVPGVNPESGKLWQGGTTSVNKRIQLEFLDRMIKDMGQTNAVNWLLSDHTVKEINGFRQKYGNIKSGIDGKLNDTRRGLFAFGPKVGPFVSNLNGIHDVTVDQWMIRTFNRYFGTMIGPDGQIVDAPTEPQRRAVKDLVNKAAEDANIKPYQVQSLLWFYEQRLYDKIGLPTKSYGFSDGGRRFLEEAGGRGGQPSVRPAAAPTEEVTPKYSISGKRITDTPELRQAAKQSAIVDADGNLIPMYHGTAALIRIFRGKQAGATFVSPDPEFAAGFTSASRDWMVRHIGQFLRPDEIRKAVQELRQAVYAEYGKQSKTTSKIMDEIYEVLREAKETGVYRFKGELQDMWTPIAFSKIPGAKERVMELYVLAKNPFDFESKDSVNKVIKQMLTDPEVKRQYGYAPAPAGVDLQKPENFMLRQTLERTDKEFKAAVEEKFKDNISRGSWRAIETPEVQRAIRKFFDSFYVIEGGVKNLGVYDPRLIKSADENVGPFGQRPPTEEEAKAAEMILEDAIKAQEEGDIRFSLRSKPFDSEKLPTSGRDYTLSQNTILYHGAYRSVADAIQSVGYLTSRPKIKAHGGLMNEGGLVWFGSKETAQKYANSEADPGKVRFDREEGIIREPGKVFEAITDRPYKLISRYKVLSEKEAAALNEALGLPDYKRLKAGDSADTAAYRAGVDSNSNAERFEIKSGKYTETISAPWPIILKTLNADGFYSDGTVALTAENGIRLSEEGKPMERFSLRAPQTPEFKRWFGDSKVVDAKGEPLVVYHGTPYDFSAFRDKSDIAPNIKFENYFSADPIHAAFFARKLGDDRGQIMPVFLSIKNPMVVEGTTLPGVDEITQDDLDDLVDRAKSNGHDGVLIKNFADANAGQADTYITFESTQIKSAIGNIGTFEPTSPDIRKSLRSSADPAINARILQTTTAREEKTFPQRITQALGPESYSRFRAAALNRYNSLGVADKKKAKMMGGIELLADSNAESAALNSDLAAGIVAGALGVYDKIGGVPVYNRHYVVERAIQGPRGTQFIQVGGKIQSRQAAEAMARRFPDAAVRERGYTAVTNLNNTVKGPLAIFAPLAKLGNPDAYRAYQYWAGVKRGSKWMTVTSGPRKGQVVEQLFEPADIPKAEKLRQEYLAQGVDFDQIQKEWTAYNDQLVKYMLDTGVISKENAKKFTEHGDYLPFYRQINGDDDAVGPQIFQSISAVKQPRKIKGGEDPLGDFLENMVRNTQAAVQAGLKNVAARRAADVGMDVGTVRPITQAQASPLNSFYVLENGQKVFYDTDDLLFIDAIKSLGLPDFPGIGLLSGPAGILRNLVTKDPGFMLANMMRDSLAAWTTSGVNMLPVAATLKNFTDALAGSSPEYKALLMSGVVGGYDYSQGTKDAAKQFGKELRKTAGARTVGEKAMSPFTSLWDGLEKGTQASDAATRIEVYKQTLKDTGNEAEALFRALEVMNFNRKGNNPIVRVATAAIPFLNARMQGLDVLYRAAFGKNTTSNAQAIQKAFWVRGMTMAALSSMYWLLTHDDDEYKKQEQETRDNNWLFPSLGIKIPIPFEVGVLFKVIPERIMGLTFGDDTAKDFTKSMARNLASTLAVNPIPQTILPLVEATTNFSFFTSRPIVGQGLEGVASGYQVSPGTSRLAEGLGGALNISPMKIDQVIQGYTGTIGTYMSQLIDSVYDLHTDNPKASLRFEQLPVFKRFALDPDARGQVTAYYDLKNSVDEATRTANLLERSMNWEEWGKYYSENIGMFAVKDYVLDMEKTMKEFREMKNMIRIMPMSADEKRDNLLAITQMENQLVANIQTLKKQMQ